MDEGARRRLNPGPGAGGGGGGADLLSALPDDLLHEVLVRLRCPRAAASTGVLSRRWRGLWTHLPDIVFRNATLARILPALARIRPMVQSGPEPRAGVSLLDIRVPTHHGLDDAGVQSLLDAAAGLSPADLALSLPRTMDYIDVDLPPFRRATSIQLRLENLRITLPPPVPGGAFPALEKLHLSLPGCWADLAALVLECPRLRVLSAADVCPLDDGVDILSDSLEELYVQTCADRLTDCICVEAPALKKLTMSFSTGADLSVSVVAPMLEKVSWACSAYPWSTRKAGIGPWGLKKLTLLHATDNFTAAAAREDLAWLQLSNVNNVLSLQMKAHGWFDDAGLDFVQYVEEHLVADFSALELTMQYDYGAGSTDHIYGPFVLCLLGSRHIRTATRRLHILLQRSEEKKECPVNCLCDEPRNWRSSSNISFINLEEVVIDGFEWEGHEFDFLKVIFQCAPTLRRMVVVATVCNKAVTTSGDRCTELYDIFQAYRSVDCTLTFRAW